MLATTIEADPYLGRILTGRISAGRVTPGMTIKALSRDGKVIEQGRASKVLAFRGLERVPVEEATAGEIVAIAGLSQATVADTHLRARGDRCRSRRSRSIRRPCP